MVLRWRLPPPRPARPDRHGWYALSQPRSYWVMAMGAVAVAGLAVAAYAVVGEALCAPLGRPCVTSGGGALVSVAGGFALGGFGLMGFALMKPVRWRGTEMILRDKNGRAMHRSMLDIAETRLGDLNRYEVVFSDGHILRFFKTERGADQLMTAIGDRFLVGS